MKSGVMNEESTEVTQKVILDAMGIRNETWGVQNGGT